MNQAPTMQPGGTIFRLTYRSRSRIPGAERKSVLGELFTQARKNNKARSITGALLVTQDWFVQTLEGDEGGVRELYSTIESDPRHDTFTLLSAAPAETRVFGRWSMAEVAPAEGAPDTFLIAHQDGISPAADLLPNPQQQTVLAMMRSAARGQSFTAAEGTVDATAERGAAAPGQRVGARSGPLAM